MRGKTVANVILAKGLHHTSLRWMPDFRTPLHMCKLEVYMHGKSKQIRILLHDVV